MPSNFKVLSGASGEPNDPNFKNVTLLLHGDGSNGAQNNTFIDSSTNNFTITRNGNTAQGSFSPYGSNWSNYFDGSTGYLSLNAQTALSYGTGDFTMEAWVNPASINSGFAPVIEARASSSASTYAFGLRVSGGVYKAELYTGTQYTGSTTVPLNTWTHIAVSRSSGTLRIFVNGVLDTSWSSVTASIDANATDQRIGVLRDGTGFYFSGYISNFRAVKGTAVYTAAFTPSTTPLTAITNTSLLTCAYNRFRDGSTNNFTITRNGDVKVTNFAPFAPSSAYSTSTNGGSAYFDGSGDWLEVPNNTAFAYGTGDLTLECWIYKTSTSDTGILENRSGSGMIWYIDSAAPYAGMMRIYDGSGFYNSNTVVPLNQWVHLVACRQSGTLRYFVNGVAAGSMSWTTDLGSPTSLKLMRSNEASQYGGWMSQMRIVKGTAVYTAAFTPPTAPLTAISGTSLLVNATNAAIFDNSMKNDLETVGNAQISTSVKKFGTGSMAFDGTGDYLLIPASQDLTIGTSDFTIEMWIYSGANGTSTRTGGNGAGASWSANKWVFATGDGGNPNKFIFGVNNITSTAAALVSTTTFNDSVWRHVAITRSGSTWRLFVNGTQEASATSSASLDGGVSANITLGRSGISSDADWAGYIDDFRMTKGIARYTSNFTPPTAPFPNK